MVKNQFQSPFRETFKDLWITMNVGATVTAKSSQACSAREKKVVLKQSCFLKRSYLQMFSAGDSLFSYFTVYV